MESWTCPFPIQQYPQVLLAHGGGGKLMQQLIEQMFTKAFGPKPKEGLHDSTVLNLPSSKIAYTTDSFVVKPIFFPGGDIGKLSVFGTVNDLAMSGARPLYLSLGFILEEGLPMTILWKIVQSIKEAADSTGVQIVTGDTKVVDKGKGYVISINTSGIGVIEHPYTIAPVSVQPKDAIIINGDLGRHGISIMASREGLEFETVIESDCAALSAPVQALLKGGIEIHCLRDLTRGGLASALNEIAQAANLSMSIDESSVPVREDVASACALLGFDPLYVANEGRFVLVLPEHQAQQALEILKPFSEDFQPARIGQIQAEKKPIVVLQSCIGSSRILDMISGEQLPRIC
ncbi:MAG: hydrogenase expression/formation protein HypE [Candidatus Omnitrophica bacterium]|nr:hydrogenase expression/formation protein HypE [Candidatus Omnitrophota bacterium]